MSINDKFLNEINLRIQAVSADVGNIKYNRNKVLEIENILFKKGIDKNNLNFEELLKLSMDDYAEVVSFLEDKDYINNLEVFDSRKTIVNRFKDSNEKVSPIDQELFQAAVEYLEQIAADLNNFMKDFTSENTVCKANERNNVKVLKTYEKMFKAGELTKPVFEVDKFHRVVDFILNDEEEKGRLKANIGRANISLTMDAIALEEDKKIINKYHDILDKKLKKVKKFVEPISKFLKKYDLTDVNIENAVDRMEYIASKNPDLTFTSIQNVIICLLMMDTLGKVNESIKSEMNTSERRKVLEQKISELNNILDLAEIKKIDFVSTVEDAEVPEVIMPEDLTMTRLDLSALKEEFDQAQPQPTKDTLDVEVEPLMEVPESEGIKFSEESENIINRINEILEIEDEFLQSINPDVYERYTQLLELTDPTRGKVELKNRLAMIVETLRKDIAEFKIIAPKYFESPKEFNKEYSRQRTDILKCLDVYNILKARYVQEQNKKQIIYLADHHNNAAILNYLDDLDTSQKENLCYLIDDLSEKDIRSKRLGEYENINIISSTKKDVTIYYGNIKENLKIILFALPKAKGTDNVAKEIIDKYLVDLEIILEKDLNNPFEVTLIMDEQAGIREKLANYLGEIEAKKK